MQTNITTTQTVYDDGRMRLFHGDSMELLKAIPDDTYDAVITDPPYASGGVSSTQRGIEPAKKYQNSETKKQYPTFENDTRDDHSHYLWSIEWMRRALNVTKPSGWLIVFTDWRQLPLTSCTMRVAGWSWYGILPWDKTEQCRPQTGMFRNQCEYALIGVKGKRNRTLKVYPAGIIREPMFSRDKLHLTAKPVRVMKHMMSVLQPDSYILDPFTGSSTTLIAADSEGHRCDGIELSADYCTISINRMMAYRMKSN